ncbi:MAG: ATP-dependent phosphofructokinase / diphosphate-dependent phosphofructokinase [Epulopiscium sp.]|jgi:6-phosphofructokinase 1|uniref:Pyrophosphate--fructose 6-phosphate 1-phosphotransferase n=1 Tax=Defluviitalea raffinosedens TaxID=1450156 RepID=A0A7C8HDP8_9FIRM|nr:6-phosphofructokinase [Defluviitalea raffinosedens]KAE9630228.1 diphosphate--fructose-6-phosphate 1-phosphotransferase [Defluviitalea raffinosedens]MBZ4669652.1 phosphofructokinase [Defluviitaleaceae bacterium]MDK2787003.1 ATP-dependent phosphofructokinase / diphosphate-dependent phosphofructokinase [Candidatus Epulonipiscium sp.]HHW67722.1 6-phosphofructokinase [Candidatus Epulonipiscium sp.]
MISGNCIIAQSGGPTTAINSSACGAIFEALNQKSIEKVFGARNGIQGILNEELFDFAEEEAEELKYLKTTPSSALGSCRYRLKQDDSSDYEKIFKVFTKYNIRYFFYIGGNDSMDTVKKIHDYAQKINYEIRVIGIPKTIDNDLVGTDHCPGFGSAAKYIATSILEMSHDAHSYKSNIVTIVEVMGRNAGWLAAASALTKATDLIYLPEAAFDFKQFEKDVRRIYEEKGKVMIVVSEGIKDKDGRYVSTLESVDGHDNFGHAQLGGVGSVLEQYVKEHIEKRVKKIELNILQRCAMHYGSKTDIEEAYMVGKQAVIYGVQGKSGYMVGLKRISNDPYICETELVDIHEVANFEKKLPSHWINKEGNFVTKECIEYLAPLIMGEVVIPTENGLPRYARLKKKLIAQSE